MPHRPLQNRVTPTGDIIADPARGAWMGNRGGRFHSDARTLGRRRWASKAWITCVLQHTDARGRIWQRDVMGAGYTELFFLDEATALSAGHRPCALCRRHDFNRFMACWADANGLASMPIPPTQPRLPRVGHVDPVLHRERTVPPGARPELTRINGLPDGAFVWAADHDRALLVAEGQLYAWSPQGYQAWTTDGHLPARSAVAGRVHLITPPSVLAVLQAGYQPQIDASARG